MVIPCYTGLVSILQEDPRNCIQLPSTFHGVLDNFRWLATYLVSQPTPIAKFIPEESSINCICAAAATRMECILFFYRLQNSPPMETTVS